MKFCVYCGNSLEDDARFCEECGQEQTAEPITEQALEQTASVPVAVQAPAAASTKKSRWPLLIVLISVGVVVMTAAGVLLAWGLGLFDGDEQHLADEDSLAASLGAATASDPSSNSAGFTHDELIATLDRFANIDGVSGAKNVTTVTADSPDTVHYSFTYWDDLIDVTIIETNGEVVSINTLALTNDFPSTYSAEETWLLAFGISSYPFVLCEPGLDHESVTEWHVTKWKEEATIVSQGIIEAYAYTSDEWQYSWVTGDSSVTFNAGKITDSDTVPDSAATTTTTRPTVKVDGNANGVEVLPEACDVLEHYSVMADGGLHIRSGPATNYRSLGIVPENAVVTVYYRDGGWAYGAYNGQLGWLNTSYLLVYTEGVMDPGSEAAVDYHATFIVLSDNGVNMRSGPGTEFEIVGGVPYNYTVTSTLKFDDWVYCSFQGVEGWIKSEFLREIRLD